MTLIVHSTPLANPDSYTTSPGQPLDVSAADGVLANDTNPDGFPLSAQLMNGTRNGNLQFNSDGSFSYTPNPGFGGTDSFMYSAVNWPAVSAPVTVTIGVYSTPVANPDYYSAAENHTLTVGAWSDETVAILSDSQADDTVLQNALFAAVPEVFVAGEGLGSDLTAAILEMLGGPDNAMGFNTIVVWQWDVDPSLVALAQSLGFQIFVSDDLNTLIDEVQQSPLNTLGGVLDNDIPNGPALTATLGTPPANGTLTFNPDGSFSYTPNTGFIGTDTFTYTASNGYAVSAPATVTITVSLYSTPVAYPSQYSVTWGSLLNVGAPGVLTGAGDAERLPLTAQLVSPQPMAMCSSTAMGPSSTIRRSGGTDSFTFTATDGYATSAPVTVNITLYMVPVANPDQYHRRRDKR